MTDSVPTDSDALIVEFADRPGLRQVSLMSPDALHKSASAIRRAMDVIERMTDELNEAVTSRTNRPDSVKVAFGVKFDSEVGAFIAKAGVEAAITVTLTWDRNESE